MKGLFIVIFCIVSIASGCSKDAKRIRYRVISQSSAEVTYRLNGGFLNFTSISGDWSKSFRSVPGTPIYLAATKTSPIGKLTIIVFVDGNAIYSQTTEEMFDSLVIDAVVP